MLSFIHVIYPVKKNALLLFCLYMNLFILCVIFSRVMQINNLCKISVIKKHPCDSGVFVWCLKLVDRRNKQEKVFFFFFFDRLLKWMRFRLNFISSKLMGYLGNNENKNKLIVCAWIYHRNHAFDLAPICGIRNILLICLHGNHPGTKKKKRVHI